MNKWMKGEERNEEHWKHKGEYDPCRKVNVYLPFLMMKVPNHLYVFAILLPCISFYAYWLYFIYVWHVYVSPKTYKWFSTFIIKDGRYTFTFVFCLLLLSNGINVDIGHTCNTMCFYHDTIMTCALADSFCSLVLNPKPPTTRAPTHVLTQWFPTPPPQPALPHMCLRNGSQPPLHNPRFHTCAYVTNLCGECAVNKVIRNITSPKTYKCQNWRLVRLSCYR
jgi:hypothetical protein